MNGSSRFRLRTLLPAAAIAACFAAAPAQAAAPLFPQPLHLTRVVETPFGAPVTVDEYLAGNRIVTVSADRTVIVDYDAQTVTEIARGTYSITPFDELARAEQPQRMRSASVATAESDWDVQEAVRPQGRERGEYVVARPAKKGSGIVELQVGVDPTVRLSREAVEVLLGNAYPQPGNLESRLAVRAVTRRNGGARLETNAATASETLALPIEQTVTYAQDDGEAVVVRNRVTRVGSEAVPPQAIVIPAGAKRVASPAVETRRRLEELDRFSPPNH